MPVVDYGRWWDNYARLLPFGRSNGHLEFVLNDVPARGSYPFRSLASGLVPHHKANQLAQYSHEFSAKVLIFFEPANFFYLIFGIYSGLSILLIS